MSIDKACPKCGATEESRVIIPFEPKVSQQQSQEEWVDHLNELHGVVCTECGIVLGMIDIRTTGEDIDTSSDNNLSQRISNEFRIDQDLEWTSQETNSEKGVVFKRSILGGGLVPSQIGIGLSETETSFYIRPYRPENRV